MPLAVGRARRLRPQPPATSRKRTFARGESRSPTELIGIVRFFQNAPCGRLVAQERSVPIISTFFGIQVRMYFADHTPWNWRRIGVGHKLFNC